MLILELDKGEPLHIIHGGETLTITTKLIKGKDMDRLKISVDGPLSFAVVRDSALVKTSKPTSPTVPGYVPGSGVRYDT